VICIDIKVSAEKGDLDWFSCGTVTPTQPLAAGSKHQISTNAQAGSQGKFLPLNLALASCLTYFPNPKLRDTLRNSWQQACISCFIEVVQNLMFLR